MKIIRRQEDEETKKHKAINDGIQKEKDKNTSGGLYENTRDLKSPMDITSEYSPINTLGLSFLDMYRTIKQPKTLNGASLNNKLLHVMDYEADKYHVAIIKVIENFIREAKRERKNQKKSYWKRCY